MVIEVILEIIKTTVPALIVFLTVWFLFKEYNKNDYSVKLHELKRKTSETILPIRLQAYERMALFGERINLPKLLFRIRTESMTASDLSMALMVAIDQEFEHNVSQQIYFSPELWQIILMAKNEAVGISLKVAEGMPKETSGIEYSQALFKYLETSPQQALYQAQVAIKKEVAVLL